MEIVKNNKLYLGIIAVVIIAFIIRMVLNKPQKNASTSAVETIRTTKEELSDEAAGIKIIVEEAPRFPGCEDMASDAEKKKCSDEKVLRYIHDHVSYPEYAKANGVEGRCVITFVIEPDGKISQAKILSDIGGGCGEAALKAVLSMNEMPEAWKPGIEKGQKVRTRFNLPVSFKIEEAK